MEKQCLKIEFFVVHTGGPRGPTGPGWPGIPGIPWKQNIP